MPPSLRPALLRLVLSTFSFTFFAAFVTTASAQSSTTGTAPAKFSFQRGVNVSHWLSQNFDERPYAATWFTEEDVAWIAQQGFDHIRIPVDGRLWRNADGSLDAGVLAHEDAELLLFGRDPAGGGLSRTGLIERANGGTLFLDEIETAPAVLTARLLSLVEKHGIGAVA